MGKQHKSKKGSKGTSRKLPEEASAAVADAVAEVDVSTGITATFEESTSDEFYDGEKVPTPLESENSDGEGNKKQKKEID